MNTGPTTWGGWRDPAVTGSAAVTGGFPELLYQDYPAYCISVDDLPSSSGGAPASSGGGLNTTHEWNVARFRKMKICDADTGETMEAYVLMTAPTAVGSLA